jgi:hypothetical protein
MQNGICACNVSALTPCCLCTLVYVPFQRRLTRRTHCTRLFNFSACRRSVLSTKCNCQRDISATSCVYPVAKPSCTFMFSTHSEMFHSGKKSCARAPRFVAAVSVCSSSASMFGRLPSNNPVFKYCLAMCSSSPTLSQ